MFFVVIVNFEIKIMILIWKFSNFSLYILTTKIIFYNLNLFKNVKLILKSTQIFKRKCRFTKYIFLITIHNLSKVPNRAVKFSILTNYIPIIIKCIIEHIMKLYKSNDRKVIFGIWSAFVFAIISIVTFHE